jgi:hypothetical protein
MNRETTVPEGGERRIADQVADLEEAVRYHRARFIASEQRFDKVVGALLRGETICARCQEPKDKHLPGPPTVGGSCGSHYVELTRERWEAGDGTGIAT